MVRQHWFVVGLEAQKFVALGLKTGLRDGGMLAEVLQPLREVLEGCTVARTAAEKLAFNISATDLQQLKKSGRVSS